MADQAAAQGTNVKVPLISKVAYGFGDVGCNFSWMFVSNSHPHNHKQKTRSSRML